MLPQARPWVSMSPLQTLVGSSRDLRSMQRWKSDAYADVGLWIERATDAMMHEPNYAVNLELAELVNNKKANTYVPNSL